MASAEHIKYTFIGQNSNSKAFQTIFMHFLPFWQLSNVVALVTNQEKDFSGHLQYFGKLPKKNVFSWHVAKIDKIIYNSI